MPSALTRKAIFRNSVEMVMLAVFTKGSAAV